jgi:sialic acid synthase SpsE
MMKTFTLGKDKDGAAGGGQNADRVFRVNGPDGIEDAVVAVAEGVRTFEVADGSWTADAQARIEAAHVMLGTMEKKLQPCEKDNVYWMRRSITAARDLPAGHRILAGDLLWMRPMAGLPPGDEAQVIGMTLTAPMKRGEAFPARS